MAGVNFKNEEEVQDYLKNIGTEYKFSCFKEKNPEGIIFKCFMFSFNNLHSYVINQLKPNTKEKKIYVYVQSEQSQKIFKNLI